MQRRTIPIFIVIIARRVRLIQSLNWISLRLDAIILDNQGIKLGSSNQAYEDQTYMNFKGVYPIMQPRILVAPVSLGPPSSPASATSLQPIPCSRCYPSPMIQLYCPSPERHCSQFWDRDGRSRERTVLFEGETRRSLRYTSSSAEEDA